LGGKSVGETSELFLETAHNGSLIVNDGRITQVPVIVKEAAVKVRQMAPMLCSSIDRLQSNQGPTDGAERLPESIFSNVSSPGPSQMALISNLNKMLQPLTRWRSRLAYYLVWTL
jgi:hypothetical protein